MPDRIITPLVDGFGRTANNLRISVTDRCNFRCRYCMPEEGMRWQRKSELLSYEEIARTVGLLVPMGIHSIRLTGGEPLLRADLHVLVRLIRSISGIDDLSLTTNGSLLREQAPRLAEAGLMRINVSLDALEERTFADMVRRDHLRSVLEGLEIAARVAIQPIKINVVLIRGVNDHEIGSFANLARTHAYVIRFIEFMPIGAQDGWSHEKMVPSPEIIERINAMGVPLMPIEVGGTHPAERYQFEDGRGEIGFVSSVSDPFCSSCNRIRLTSDGKLRTCLFSDHETDLKHLLRSSATDEEIGDVIRDAVRKKEEGHLINQSGFIRPQRTMSQIGG